jgi:hypothetical protein
MINRSSEFMNTVATAPAYVNTFGRVIFSLLSGSLTLGLSGPVARLQAAFPPVPLPRLMNIYYWYAVIPRQNAIGYRLSYPPIAL